MVLQIKMNLKSLKQNYGFTVTTLYLKGY